MSKVTLLFPHQLYQEHPALRLDVPVYLVEEDLYFTQYPFHQAKLVFHRASMRSYADSLESNGYKVQYVASGAGFSDVRNLISQLAQEGFQQILFCDPTDDWLLRRIKRSIETNKLGFEMYPSPNFICRSDEEVAGRRQPTYFQTDFYIRQRKKKGWLLEKDGKPTGGQWSFDADNRKPLPKGLAVPKLIIPNADKYLNEAKKYVADKFPLHYGNCSEFLFPTDRSGALLWLEDFLKNRFASFGDYEDAMQPDEHLLFHSGLTPMLNVGLLSPEEVIERTLAYAEKHQIPLASVEGFLRQVTGWREFIRLVYLQAGRKQRTTNYWKFKRKIPESFWVGETGIIPIDTVIKKLLRTGYSHHIERLMILGNFMLLCEFDPDEVYKWFMTLYIDAYDWVMVPNVYGMTQFADGGLMTTKPYISGSNYLMKMGKWEKGEWQAVWDGLFWRFMDKHRSFFTQNPRLGMLIRSWDKMDPAKRENHLRTAERFLQKLDAS